jgi:hypothetical protein
MGIWKKKIKLSWELKFHLKLPRFKVDSISESIEFNMLRSDSIKLKCNPFLIFLVHFFSPSPKGYLLLKLLFCGGFFL